MLNEELLSSAGHVLAHLDLAQPSHHVFFNPIFCSRVWSVKRSAKGMADFVTTKSPTFKASHIAGSSCSLICAKCSGIRWAYCNSKDHKQRSIWLNSLLQLNNLPCVRNGMHWQDAKDYVPDQHSVWETSQDLAYLVLFPLRVWCFIQDCRLSKVSTISGLRSRRASLREAHCAQTCGGGLLHKASSVVVAWLVVMWHDVYPPHSTYTCQYHYGKRHTHPITIELTAESARHGCTDRDQVL